MTYGEYGDHLLRWGGYLQRQGLVKGCVVAVLSPNTIDLNPLAYGTMLVGCVYTGIKPRKKVPLTSLAQKALELAQLSIPLVCIGPAGPDSLARAEEIMMSSEIAFAEPAQLSGEEVVAVVYSSGTSGPPKGVCVTHNAAIASLDMMKHPMFYIPVIARDQEDVSITQLFPLFHVAGLIAVGALGLRQGFRLVNFMRFDPRTFLDNIFTYKVNGVHLLPSLMNFALTQEKFNPENCRHIDAILTGAAPVPQSSAEAVMRRVGPQARLFHGYGMTEMLFVSQDPVYETRYGSTGLLFPGLEAKVRHVETGETLAPGDRGELCLRGPSMMKEYLNNVAATRDAIDDDGWYHTGDVGCFDDEGFLKIIDRTKEMIKVNAYQVSPSELEDVILQLGEVQEVCVLGVPHPKTGEAPRAFVRTSVPIGEDKVVAHVAAQCARYKHLTGGVEFV
ncbi:luciferin 4-monooxygenase, partial [Hyalella azteca]|uniref:Luciferin 4-monooxygenase n=1 Tax=Hyalella azteca TaxID=294128 RepID=A0A8B7NP18_HYAAZ